VTFFRVSSGQMKKQSRTIGVWCLIAAFFVLITNISSNFYLEVIDIVVVFADVDELSDENLCKVCMAAPIDCVLLDCGHLVTCTTCGKQMSECPICRQFVVRCVKIFRA
jgi:Zinc finger, C3HC4 type (RING finger)